MTGRQWALGLCSALLVLLAMASAAAGAATPTDQAPVLVTGLAGSVSPVSANVLIDAVGEAEEQQAAALLVEIDTPGGLVTSMRQVVARFLNAQVPVITYVAPNGARAASAGTMITISGNVAAMAPTTTIGAATPVTLGGGEVSGKVVNDAASYAEAVAEARGRDTVFARDSVVTGASITATQALDAGVIDLIAPNRLTLLAQLDGTTVELGDGTTEPLSLAGAPIVELDAGWTRNVLDIVVDPNLTFVLLALGTLSLLVEFANPGVGAGGITGVILLLLAGFSLSLLPTTLVGVALLLLAAGLFIGELFVPGTGVMAAGGTVALVVAGLFLFDRTSGLSISQPVLLIVATIVLTGSTALAIAARNARAQPYRLDDEQLVDRLVDVVVANGDQGQAVIDGERWHVRTEEPPLEPGMRVRVLERFGLTLLVEPDDDWRQ